MTYTTNKELKMNEQNDAWIEARAGCDMEKRWESEEVSKQSTNPINHETQRQIDFWKLKSAEYRDKYLALLEEDAIKNHELKIKYEERDRCAEDLRVLAANTNALLHQIDLGDFVDSNGHSAKMLKPVHDLMRLLSKEKK